MPSLAKIPGTLRHGAMKGLAATRPHDRTFHSRLLQLEVEFNERVRYLPTPQRLSEFDAQCEAIRRGLVSVVPQR